jgi:TolB protein
VNPFRLFNLPCDDPRFCYWNGLLSPDDSKILGDYLDDSKAEPTTIGIGDIQEGNFIPILKPPRGSGIYYAWSPDSEKAIINAVIFEGNYDIFIVNADGSDLINLTLAIDESMQFANWSPDSSQILANNAPVERTGQYDIYVINIDGSSLTNLTQRSNESEVPICWLKE